MLFKFWKWRISVKIRSMDTNSRITFLAQNLTEELVKSGRKLNTVPGLASFQVSIYHDAQKGNQGAVNNIINEWNIPIGEVSCVSFEQEKSPCANMD